MTAIYRCHVCCICSPKDLPRVPIISRVNYGSGTLHTRLLMETAGVGIPTSILRRLQRHLRVIVQDIQADHHNHMHRGRRRIRIAESPKLLGAEIKSKQLRAAHR